MSETAQVSDRLRVRFSEVIPSWLVSMSEKNYDWKRFWCPRSGRINLADGYVDDPETKWGNRCNPDLVTLEEISETRCLILLGEPGIGKSQELEKFKTFTENKVGNPQQIFYIELRSCTNLKEDLFKDKIFTDWLAGKYDLHLFLDSLDEGILNIHNLSTVLIDEFKKTKYKNHISRLHFRLTCRTFVFPEVLEEGLRKLWEEDNFSIYELAPLRRKDVIDAAKIEGFCADNFLKEVYQKNIVPLAIKPITLNFLFNIYRRNGEFLSEQKRYEFYHEGCKCLCEAVNKGRLASGQVGNFDRDQRLIVAARIAAITIFANRFAVWTSVDLGNVPSEDIFIQTLHFGYEKAGEREFEINREVIKEVFEDTGLFTSRGLNRMGWAHQTYAEFLAAWYLIQHEIPLEQIKQLIFSSEDPDHKLIPQLHETAAWLASMNPDVLQEILKTDPDVLLESDVPIDAKIRSSIVDNLLKQYEEGKLCFQLDNTYRYYTKLKHPGLVEQLRPYVCDSNTNINSRHLAINIIEACGIFEFQDELLKVALNSSELTNLRATAVKALCAVGNATTKSKLKPLFIEKSSEDVDNRLKGYVLQSLWPNYLTVEELFQSLTPSNKLFFDEYQWFIEYDLGSKLKADHLVLALDWIKGQGLRYFGHPFEKVTNTILLKALEHFDVPGVIKGFTEVALIQLRGHQKIITHDSELQSQIYSFFLKDHEKRHSFIQQVVLVISKTGEDLYFPLIYLIQNVLIVADFFWMIEKLQNCDCENTQKVWGRLIQWSFNLQNAKQIDAIVAATQTNSVLEKFFAPLLTPVELNSSQADVLRADYLRTQEMQKPQKTVLLLDPPPKERVLQRLDELDRGNLDAWRQLNMEMTLKPESRYYDEEFQSDLTQLPGWQEADDITQRKILEYAKEYIKKQDNIDYSWIGTNLLNSISRVYCRTLLLVWQKCPDFYNNLSLQVWERWTPIIIASNIYTQNSGLELIKYAYRNACNQFIETVIFLIDKDNQKYDHLSVIRRLEKCWDEPLKLRLLEKAKDPSLKPECTRQLLDVLLKKGLTEANDFASSLIRWPLPSDKKDREKALMAARILVENSDSSSWSLIWKIIQKDSLFGREVLELVAHRSGLFGVELSLTEVQLTDLYIWLVNQYSYEEDPEYPNNGQARDFTPRDGIKSLRNSVLWQLKERGTVEACTQIQRLIQELPDLPWLGKTLIDAQTNMRRTTWEPMETKQLLEFIINNDPSHLDLFNEITEVNRSIKKMENEPKIDQSIHMNNSNNSGIIRTGDGDIQNTNNLPTTRKEFDWKFWLTITVTVMGVTVGLLTVTASGVFNNEIRNFLFNENSSPQMDDNSEGESLKNDN